MSHRAILPRPVPPAEPEPWQCCGSGCEPCIYDRYWDDMERYERALEQWERDHGRADPDAGPEVDKGGVSP